METNYIFVGRLVYHTFKIKLFERHFMHVHESSGNINRTRMTFYQALISVSSVLWRCCKIGYKRADKITLDLFCFFDCDIFSVTADNPLSIADTQYCFRHCYINLTLSSTLTKLYCRTRCLSWQDQFLSPSPSTPQWYQLGVTSTTVQTLDRYYHCFDWSGRTIKFMCHIMACIYQNILTYLLLHVKTE